MPFSGGRTSGCRPRTASWWHVPLKLSWEEFDSQWTKQTVNQSVHLWKPFILIFLSCIASISLQRVILAFCVPQYPEWGRLYALLALRNPSLPSACAAQHRRSRPSPTYFLLSYRAFCAAAATAAAASAAPLNHSTAAARRHPFHFTAMEMKFVLRY